MERVWEENGENEIEQEQGEPVHFQLFYGQPLLASEDDSTVE